MSKSELAVWVPPPGASRQAHAAGGRQQSEQLRLFNEVIETIVVRDQPFVDGDGAWGTRTTRPPGDGWRVADYEHEKRTRWERPRLVPAWRRT